MKRLLTLAFLALTAPFSAVAQGNASPTTEIELDSGNIELAVIDGTTISVAPGTRLTIDPAQVPGDVTRINVLRGEFRVSNVFHKHSDLVLIRAGEHIFELNRGAALIRNDGTRPQGILLHGNSLSLQGRPNKLTRPATRLTPAAGDGGPTQDKVGPDVLSAAMNKVSGRAAGRALGVVRKKPRMLNRRTIVRRPDQHRLRSQVVQRGGFQNVVNAAQGLGAPPPPKPPKMKPPKRPPMGHPPPPANPPRGNPPRGNPPRPVPPRHP